MDFDSIDQIKKIDPEGVYNSLLQLSDQCTDAWNEATKVDIPSDYKDVDNIVLCGMGGSGLGARVIESVFFDKLTKPITRVNGYHLPNFVNEKSLVVCSSYSGSTEETLENVDEAIKKRAKWMAIGTGGDLIEKSKSAGVPYYQINPIKNPSNQPRMAIGYSIVGQLALLNKTGLISITEEEISDATQIMREIVEINKAEVEAIKNAAKTLSLELKNKIVVLISGEHLVGATHVFNNQINENSKNFSADYTIPELNHHLMEGLSHPEDNEKNIHVLFINSNLYSDKITKRFEVTKEVIGKNSILYSNFTADSSTRLSQVFEVIQFGAFVNFYLAIAYGQNPSPIPWVDYFKERLSK